MVNFVLLLILLVFFLMISYFGCDRDIMAPDVLYLAGFVLAIIVAGMNIKAWGIDLSIKTIIIILLGALSFLGVGGL